MSPRTLASALSWIGVISLIGPPAFGQTPPATDPLPELIAPAFRAERHFGAGAEYLRSLPDGTEVQLQRLDGAAFTLRLSGGRFNLELAKATLSSDRKLLTTPFGYQLWFDLDPQPGLRIKAPGGHSTLFFAMPWNKGNRAFESDAKIWEHWEVGIVLRLSDGSRIDCIDEGTRWELITLDGERFGLDLKSTDKLWETFPPIPSPPLIPDTDSYYIAGDGNDWYRPAREDHVVFAWNWYPLGFTVAQLLEDLASGPRRDDLNFYFNGLERVQRPVDMGGVILGRRLALAGGDQLSIHVPGHDPELIFILPGPLDPDHFEPRTYRDRLPSLRQTPGR
jgi:hypothetical protein